MSDDETPVRLFTIAELDFFRAKLEHGDQLGPETIARLCTTNAFMLGRLRGQAELFELYAKTEADNATLREQLERCIAELNANRGLG